MGGYGPNYRYLKHVRPGYAVPFKCVVPDKDGFVRNLITEEMDMQFQLLDTVATVTLGDGTATGGDPNTEIFLLPDVCGTINQLNFHANLRVDGKVISIIDAYGVLGSGGGNDIGVGDATEKFYNDTANQPNLDTRFQALTLEYDSTVGWTILSHYPGIPG